MSKYNSYAKRLEAAFMEARKQYSKIADKLTAAEREKEKANGWYEEKYVGERAAKIARAEANLLEARAAFDRGTNTIWAHYEQEADSLTRELSEAVRADNTANPDAIDTNALEIMKSGIMSADDYESFLSRFDTNPTMLKMIAKYADAAAENTKEDNKLRMRLSAVAIAARDGQNATMRDWNQLVSAAHVLTGQSHGSATPDYGMKMVESWESMMGDAIRGF